MTSARFITKLHDILDATAWLQATKLHIRASLLVVQEPSLWIRGKVQKIRVCKRYQKNLPEQSQAPTFLILERLYH